MSGWLTALRVARREARRAKGRSALVVALIALPVLGLSFAAVSYDSFRLTTAQELDRELGAADASVRWQHDGPVTQPVDGRGFESAAAPAGGEAAAPPVTGAALLAVLPAGSRLVPVRRGEVELRTATGIARFGAEWLDLTDPVHAGRVVLRDGRAPAASHETALTRLAARRLGATLGDRVSAADGSGSWTVVGIVEYPERFREAVLLPPTAGAAVPQEWLVAAPGPVTWEQVRQLNQHGIVVRSRAVVLDPPPPEQVPGGQSRSGGPVDGPALAIGVLVVGLALLEVVLLAGPAFAVGARRRQRELALVAANGGTPRQQRRIVLAEGIVLGLTGAAVGIALGVAAAVAGLPLLEEHQFARRAGGLRLWPAALAGIAGVAVIAGVLAALVPAAIAARQNVVLALAGRRGTVRRRRWLVLGLGLVGLGAAVAGVGVWRTDAGVLLAGLVTGQLGLVLGTPALVGLVARAGRFLPLPPRVALRDIARNRAATAPAVAAVMAAVAGSLALGTFLASDGARVGGQYRSSLPVGAVHVPYEIWHQDGRTRLSDQQRAAVRTALRDTLPADQLAEVPEPACPADAEPGTDCGGSVRKPPQNQCPYLAVERALTPAEQRAARADPRCDDSFYAGFFLGTVVDDGTLLQTLTGGSAEVAAVAALRAGGAVVSDPGLLVNRTAMLELREGPTEVEFAVPAYLLATSELDPFTVFVSPRVLADAGFGTEPSGVVATTSTAPSQAELDALTAALRGIHGDLAAYVERGEPAGSGGEDPTLVILAIAAGVITLAAAGIATGLAAADRRPDLATLGVVGASPRVRRLLSLSQSGVIAGLGAVLGTVTGLGTAVAVLAALNQAAATGWPPDPRYPLIVPWPSVAIGLGAVPLVAMLGAGLLTRSRLPIERRR